MRGVDVSMYQGTVDWSTVAASGVSFGYAAVADGTNPDPTFQQNYLGMKWAGMQRGAYLVFEPNVDPVAQADTLIAALQFNGFVSADLPPAFDVEATDGITSGAQIAASLQTALARVQSVLGVRPSIYTSPGWWDGNVGSAAFGIYPLWVGNWGWGLACPSVPMGWSSWQTWQYADNGYVPGVPRSVDLDEKAVPVMTQPTTTVFTATSATSGDFHDPTTVQARVTNANGPIAGGFVEFGLIHFQSRTCTAMTDANGVATCSDFVPDEGNTVGAGVGAHFVGQGIYAPSDAVEPFTITPEEDTLTYTGVRGPILAGSTVTLSARLLEDGTTPISDAPVQLGLPNQPCLQTTTSKDGTTTTGSYTTDATGDVTCTLTVEQPLGPSQISASFDGGGATNLEWAPAADGATALVYAFPAEGVPVLRSDATTRTFWVANTTSKPPACGASWTAQPNSEPHPPATLPVYMGYVVSGPLVRNRGTFSGTIAHLRVENTTDGATAATVC